MSHDTSERSDDAPFDTPEQNGSAPFDQPLQEPLQELVLPPVSRPGNIRTAWFCPLREGGPDVLFVVETDHDLVPEEMAERVRWARAREDAARNLRSRGA